MSYVSALPGINRIQAKYNALREDFAAIRRIPSGLAAFESEMSAWREACERGEMNAVEMLRLRNEIDMAKVMVGDLAGRLRAAEELPADLAIVDGSVTGTGVNTTRAEHIRTVREAHALAAKHLGKLEDRLSASLAGAPDTPRRDPQVTYDATPASQGAPLTASAMLRGLRSI